MLLYHLQGWFFSPIVLILLCFEPGCCFLLLPWLPEPVLAVAGRGYAIRGRCRTKPLRQICACVYASLSISH